ncbi:MAG: type II 3-dehydroquinate dehydratase [Rhodospirillaceae bacterium]|nr:type II 3-dehydroquinate dehydratase [Rhodospirillaceae bacterium]
MTDTHNVLVLNGPNLNMLGVREPEVYGSETLESIETSCQRTAKRLDISVLFKQSNIEGTLVSWIQEARESQDAVIINAGAFTHTSIAILDALQLVEVPVIELHLSNIFAREEFRHHSYISPCATGVICGFGAAGYELALEATKRLLDN